MIQILNYLDFGKDLEMDVNIKKIFFALFILSIYTYSNDTYKNKNIVLQELKNNINESKSILSKQIDICLTKSNLYTISLKDKNILTTFSKEHVLNFLKYKYHHNFNNCLEKKDYHYIYDLTRLYHAQKEYHINTIDTLTEIEDYFEPIEALDKRIEHKKYSQLLQYKK